MRSFWFDPYLWIHLAGAATLPIFLGLCLVGLGVGDPLFPVWLELLFVAAVGVVPILWMQWQRPFYIFSLMAVTLKPEHLTDDQRRLLTLFQSQRNRVLAALVSVGLLVLLRQIYVVAPIATDAFAIALNGRILGLLLGAIAFFACNLFLQVPVSVLGVMLTSEAAFATTSPYPVEQIQQRFTLVGLPISQILPPLVSDSQAVADVGSQSTAESAVLSNPVAIAADVPETFTDPTPSSDLE